MAPKYHPTPLSGGDRKALSKELGNSRAMANILAIQSAELQGIALFRMANRYIGNLAPMTGVFPDYDRAQWERRPRTRHGALGRMPSSRRR
jgi:hypothetical protein